MRSSTRWATGCSGGSIGQNTVASTFPGLLDGIQVQCDYSDSITTGIEGRRLRAAGQLLRRHGVGHADDQRRHEPGPGRRQEDRHQRPHRPDQLPLLEQLLRLQQQAGQLHAAVCHRRRGRSRAGADDQQLQAAGLRRSTTPPPTRPVRAAATPTSRSPSGAWPQAPRAPTRPTTTSACSTASRRCWRVTINAEEFVTLNEGVGGSDADSNPTTARSVADAAALADRLQERHRLERRATRQAADHRPARLRREHAVGRLGGHPLHLAQLRRTRPS